MRILHFSDIHLRESHRLVPFRDWVGKRAIGGVNLALGRWRHFTDALAKVAALDEFRREQEIDFVICTGDYTALGTKGELAMARAAVEPLMKAPLGYAHVPGNHDLYALDVVREKRFLRAFGDTLTTDFPEYCTAGGPWPTVKLVGDNVAVIALDSARPNPLPWRSSGWIPSAQLDAFQRILANPRLDGRFLFLITHYAARLANGQPDRWHHGLTNADDFLAIAANVPRGAMLCGHIHRPYVVRLDNIAAPLFCAGSTTQIGRESFWVFDMEDGEDGAVSATRGRWSDGRYELDPESTLRF
jgi:3',5'-cyclic AMP phosphodiesterase CpdA